jgi:hypothetical protein
MCQRVHFNYLLHFRSAILQSVDIGNIRETFFYNQMRVNHDVVSSKISDFMIGGRTFEVGGKNKK